METLRIRWAGGEASFEPGTTVRVGRDVDAEVQLRNTNLSRRHVEIVHSAGGWVLRDVGSAQGTWRDGRQVQTVDIRGTVQVTLGREGRGEVLTLEASAAAPPSTGTQEPPGRGAFTGPTQIVGGPVSHGAAASGGGDGTAVVGASGSNRPRGALRAEALAGATVVTGDVLNIECAGRSYSFTPGSDVSIGRDAECDIVSHNPTVSRRHARITHDGSGWTLRDEGSSGGTFVDGERIKEYRLAGSVAVWLGDVTTGERLVVVASGTNPRKARKKKSGGVPTKFVVAGAVVALALIVGIISLLAGGDDDAPNNDQLARATVRLLVGNSAGSGTIIDAKLGLILTNAHVVEPDAPGMALGRRQFASELRPSVGDIEVLVAPALDKAAEPRFFAEVVAVDGYLDLAVIKITTTTIGQLIEPGDLDELVAVPVGDSKALSTGDHIDVFGYPVVAQTSNVTLTDGVVSGPVKDVRLGTNRGMINISADIRGGNSGGLAVNATGELVGVPTLTRGPEGSVEQVASMRPSEFAKGLIDAARKGEAYVSPYFRKLTTEEVSNIDLVEPNETGGIRFECTNAPIVSTAVGGVGVSFSFKGFEVDEHQDMMVQLWDGNVPIGLRTLDRDYPVKWPAAEGCATITVPIDTSQLSEVPDLGYTLGIGPGYTPPG